LSYLCTPKIENIQTAGSRKLALGHQNWVQVDDRRVSLAGKIKINMKKEIHPNNYRPVVFKDMSNEEIFISRSTINAKETIEIDGVTYPLVKLEITSSSHPFYTGKQKLVDTAGRVDKFMSRYGNRNKKK
jgi:large subunit ribosomal protein L31